MLYSTATSNDTQVSVLQLTLTCYGSIPAAWHLAVFSDWIAWLACHPVDVHTPKVQLTES